MKKIYRGMNLRDMKKKSWIWRKSKDRERRTRNEWKKGSEKKKGRRTGEVRGKGDEEKVKRFKRLLFNLYFYGILLSSGFFNCIHILVSTDLWRF